jgi:hypothetical protein
LSLFFWALCCLSFFYLRILVTSLWYLVAIVLSVLLRFTDSGYLPLVSCGHCVVCPSSIYGFWLPPFGILWPLCCLSFFYLRILVTPLVSSNYSLTNWRTSLHKIYWKHKNQNYISLLHIYTAHTLFNLLNDV